MNESVENDINREQSETDHNFDSFILENFTPYSGEKDVNTWLNETEEKFNQLLVPRSLRFTAILLLVIGRAKKIYIMNRRNIQSFGDFYEILLSYFDKVEDQSTRNILQNGTLLQSNLYHPEKSLEGKTLQTVNSGC